jgi:hypothetical protein
MLKEGLGYAGSTLEEPYQTKMLFVCVKKLGCFAHIPLAL